MRGIASVFSVNVARAAGRPWYIAMTSAFMLVAIVAAVFVANRLDGRPTIAYVGQNVAAATSSSAPPSAALSSFARIETLSEAPPLSALMRGRYDAVVIVDGNGVRDVLTVRGPAFKEQLDAMLAGGVPGEVSTSGLGGTPGEQPPVTPDAAPGSMPGEAPGGVGESRARGVGATVVGFLTMFVLISGATYMNFFTDDKTGGTFRRIAASPTGAAPYLAGQLLFNGTMLFVPMMGMLVVLGELVGLDIGFSYEQYGALGGLLTVLATAFGFFVAALVENVDDGMAVASGVIIVTSLLGGSFFVFEHDDVFMRQLTRALPQKQVMDIAAGFEAGLGVEHALLPGLYVLGVAAAFVVAGGLVCIGRLRQGAYS